MLNISCSEVTWGDYMPLEVGNEWYYRVFGDGAPGHLATRVRIVRQLDDFFYDADYNGRIYRWGKIDNQVFFSRKGGILHFCLKLPPEVGKKWEQREGQKGVRYFWKITAIEDITTPAGLRFKDCIRVELEKFHMPVVQRFWFKEDVGIVRYARYDRARDREVSGFVLIGCKLKNRSGKEAAGPREGVAE